MVTKKSAIILVLWTYAGLALSGAAEYFLNTATPVPALVGVVAGLVFYWRSVQDDGRSARISARR